MLRAKKRQTLRSASLNSVQVTVQTSCHVESADEGDDQEFRDANAPLDFSDFPDLTQISTSTSRKVPVKLRWPSVSDLGSESRKDWQSERRSSAGGGNDLEMEERSCKDKWVAPAEWGAQPEAVPVPSQSPTSVSFAPDVHIAPSIRRPSGALSRKASSIASLFEL
jgi:hypothetical protein